MHGVGGVMDEGTIGRNAGAMRENVSHILTKVTHSLNHCSTHSKYVKTIFPTHSFLPAMSVLWVRGVYVKHGSFRWSVGAIWR